MKIFLIIIFVCSLLIIITRAIIIRNNRKNFINGRILYNRYEIIGFTITIIDMFSDFDKLKKIFKIVLKSGRYIDYEFQYNIHNILRIRDILRRIE
jgi:hypothetical protein